MRRTIFARRDLHPIDDQANARKQRARAVAFALI
jgi:hypothetical protein